MIFSNSIFLGASFFAEALMSLFLAAGKGSDLPFFGVGFTFCFLAEAEPALAFLALADLFFF